MFNKRSFMIDSRNEYTRKKDYVICDSNKWFKLKLDNPIWWFGVSYPFCIVAKSFKNERVEEERDLLEVLGEENE